MQAEKRPSPPLTVDKFQPLLNVVVRSRLFPDGKLYQKQFTGKRHLCNIKKCFVIHKQMKIDDKNERRFGARCHNTIFKFKIIHFELKNNGVHVMTTPKRRSFLLLIFTCLFIQY